MSFDMSATIVPKSDQLNADDLLAGPRTIVITRVTGGDNPDQPVNVHFDGDAGKPYKPCKSMRRVMVHAWGPDAAQYVGRAITLYCDQSVQFGGMKVGGIRISHMSHIDRDLALALTATRSKRTPYAVKRLAEVPQAADPAAEWAQRFIAGLPGGPDYVAKNQKRLDALQSKRPDLHAQCLAAIAEHAALDEPTTTEEEMPL